jgi:16S rRNA (adenine1518-N6/adenine1519-N6)-dimethyltransferase
LKEKPFAVVGNFPYNISSQIVFKIIDYKDDVPVMLGMFQKEMARRICASPGSKEFGIISVLTQLYFETEYLFDVSMEAFNPPPRVVSGVMVMKRRKKDFSVDPIFFKKMVKLAFNQRRKTLRNSLKQYLSNPKIKQLEIFDLRPEQLSLDGFINLSNMLESQNI